MRILSFLNFRFYYIKNDIIVGLIGGAIGYFLKYSKKKTQDPEHKLSFMLLFVNIMIGGYTAYMFGSLIPVEATYRDFLIGAIGVSSYPILSFIESNAVVYLVKILENKFGISTEEKNGDRDGDKNGRKK